MLSSHAAFPSAPLQRSPGGRCSCGGSQGPHRRGLRALDASSEGDRLPCGGVASSDLGALSPSKSADPPRVILAPGRGCRPAGGGVSAVGTTLSPPRLKALGRAKWEEGSGLFSFAGLCRAPARAGGLGGGCRPGIGARGVCVGSAVYTAEGEASDPHYSRPAAPLPGPGPGKGRTQAFPQRFSVSPLCPCTGQWAPGLVGTDSGVRGRLGK